MPAPEPKRQWITALTDEPRQDGTTVDLVGVDKTMLRTHGLVFSDGVERIDKALGMIENVELGRADPDAPNPLALRCLVRWLEELPPGSYSAHLLGIIKKRDEDGNVLKCQARGVGIWAAGDDDNPNLVFGVKP